MKRHFSRSVLLLSVLAVSVSPTFAQQLKEPSQYGASIGSGARALAMGGAFIAIADDATAASWNPAGLCVLEKPEVSAVGQVRTKLTNDYSPYTYTYRETGYRYDERDSGYKFPQTGSAFDFASASYPFRAGSLKLVPQVNYQRAVDLGLDYTYGDGSYTGTDEFGQYRGSFNGDGAFTGGLDLYAASLGLGVTSKLYLGASFNWWRNGSDGTRTTRSTDSFSSPFGTSSSSSTNVRTSKETYEGYNLNAGAILKPSEKLRLGVVFKSPFTMKYTQTITRQISRSSGTSSTRITSEEGDIHWPRTIGGGVAVLPTDVLTLSFDFTTTKWSDATYDFTRTITTSSSSSSPRRTFFPNLHLIWPTLFDPNQPEQAGLNSAQIDTQQLRFGAEYVIKSPKLANLTALPIRAGVYTDRQLFKESPDLGKVNYLGLTAGVGLVWSRLTLDFAFVRLSGESRNDYTFSDFGFTETVTSDGPDKFRANRFFASTIVRF